MGHKLLKLAVLKMLDWNYATYEQQIGANKVPTSELGVFYTLQMIQIPSFLLLEETSQHNITIKLASLLILVTRF